MNGLDGPRIYLAGPDVFAPDPSGRGEWLKACCARHGASGLFPLDNEIGGGSGRSGRELAERIRAANLDMIRRCDAVVANMAPFRGPSLDAGTA